MNPRKALLLPAVFFLAALASGCSYNTLVAKQQNVKAKWANVETMMQRRADLIPNLFEAAKAAGVQEQTVFGQIADARAKLAGATSAPPQGANGDKSPEQKQAVLDANATLSRLLVIVENYPQLRSSESFQKFQDELAGTENRIATSRKDYNEAVQDYDTKRASFPTVITARLFGFKEEPYFKAEEGARQVPKIDANTLRPNQNANTK
jgi:LemA protein